MSEVPEGIWVFQNGLWSRDYENYHPEPTEYIRKDVSDALIAAAYVDAANLHQSLWRETSAYKTDQILKRTSTDTRQALDALLKAEREKALREAASLSWLCFHKCDVEVDVVTADDILALISEGKTDG